MAWLVIYLALLALVLWLRFRGGAWRRIQLVGPATWSSVPPGQGSAKGTTSCSHTVPGAGSVSWMR
jgi:hypothetical protein